MELMNKKESGYKDISKEKLKKIYLFCDKYIDFLNACKTEREAANFIVNKLEEYNFVNIEDIEELAVGDRVYYINRNKCVYAIIIGDNILDGLSIVGSHIDSPRLDLKPNPLYESNKLALFKTHYYGGIKKYQWTTIPLALHGVVVKANGEKIEINIGEDEKDPIFTITDLLPHLAKEQEKKQLEKAIEGENLNVLVGSMPNEDDKIKENIMKLINEKYDFTESDFNSAELELVPAFKARSLGFDKSMVAAYGQDDRSCSYANLLALINTKETASTKVAIFADKEEIGSVGNTGMHSDSFDLFINEVLNKMGLNEIGLLSKIYNKSMMLSADVGVGVDPNYEEAFDKNNASYIGYGLDVNKYTGSRGKSGASDANAEFVAKIRNIFEENDIKYQLSELGKVDLGGGGTIAYILANKGVEVIDCGVPLISMHSPYEVTSKFDIYEAYRAYLAFFESN